MVHNSVCKNNNPPNKQTKQQTKKNITKIRKECTPSRGRVVYATYDLLLGLALCPSILAQQNTEQINRVVEVTRCNASNIQLCISYSKNCCNDLLS